MKKTIIIVSIIALVIVGGVLLPRGGSNNSEIKPEFVKAKRGDLLITVKESGFLNAMEEITVTNKILLRSTEIVNVIPDGSYVKKGDFLIELDSSELLTQKSNLDDKILSQELSVNEAQNNLAITQSEVDSKVEEAKNAIYFAQLDLEKFTTLDKKRQIDQLQSDIEDAKDQANLSEQTYNASKTLVEKGFETTGKLDQDRLNLNSKTKKLDALKAQLEILIKYDLVENQQRFSNTVEEAKNRHERMIKEGENKIHKAQAIVKSNQEKLALTREELEKLTEQLSYTKLNSEVEGYALYPRASRTSSSTRRIEAGQIAGKDQVLMRIPIMSDMKVDVEVAEHFITDLALGQKTIITIDSLKDQTFQGEVSKIALLPKQNNSWLGATVQKYEVEIDVDDSTLPDSIKPQVTASAEIILDQLKNVLSVPIQAVHTVKGKQVIYVKKGSNVVEREVKIGKLETNFVEIIEGVSEGEEVLISEPQV